MKNTEARYGAPLAAVVNENTMAVIEAARKAAGRVIGESINCIISEGRIVGQKWEAMTARETEWNRYSPSYKRAEVWLQSMDSETAVLVEGALYDHIPYTAAAVEDILRRALRGDSKESIRARIAELRKKPTGGEVSYRAAV